MVLTAFAAAIVHRNHFFRLYRQNKSSESKIEFRQASNCCKSILKADKLAHATKTKESITSQKLYFWRIANSVLNKNKPTVPPLLLLPHTSSIFVLIKQNCLLKSFLRTLILMTS